MNFIFPKEISDAEKNLNTLLAQMEQAKWDWTEEDTRFQFIDDFLVYCLGWAKEKIKTEKFENSVKTDYELSERYRICVVEAKKEKITFTFSPRGYDRKKVSIQTLLKDENTKGAIDQVFDYAVKRGIEIAIIINSCQIIAFLASRSDGISPLEGNAFIIQNRDDLKSNFSFVWKFLSSYGVREMNLRQYLTVGDRAVPQKISSNIDNYKTPRYKSENKVSLQSLSELLIQDLITKENEKDFYNHCYCTSGALSQFSTISKNILLTRYSCLFPSESNILCENLIEKKKKKLSPASLGEAFAHRPIVVIGDVGVGKTSFLKNLKYNDAIEEFENAIYLYIDLGNSGSLSENLNQFVLNEIERQLEQEYNIDIYEENFVKGVYHTDICKLKKSIFGGSNDEIFNQIKEKVKFKEEHLKKIIHHLSHSWKKQIVISIDNADQREAEIQDQAFIIAHELSENWKALTFITLRPETFYQSQNRGRALSGYTQKVFTISPPKIEEVVLKRLTYAIDLASGSNSGLLNNISLNFYNIVCFFRVLLSSIENSDDIKCFLANITGGNIRQVIDFISKFIGNSNVNSDNIIKIYKEEGSYRIPLHEFSKAALIGDYSYFNEDTSFAMNLFNIINPDEKEYFLNSIILSFLSSDFSIKDNDGFVSYHCILKELSNIGYNNEQVDFSLKKLSNKKLIESMARVSYERTKHMAINDMSNGYRITSIGAYHINNWIASFSYLDAIIVDTPILDDEIRIKLIALISSFEINERYEKSLLFRDYLTQIWKKIQIQIPYFNWNDKVALQNSSFSSVKKHIEKKLEEDKKNDTFPT